MLDFFTYSISWLPDVLRIPVIALFSIVVAIALMKIITFLLNVISTIYSYILGFIQFW